ncbi:unnamed protein product [Closterium sp. Naga37s-1]|nr:unnamed protein product [Closterium sp. Naga37s-1]
MWQSLFRILKTDPSACIPIPAPSACSFFVDGYQGQIPTFQLNTPLQVGGGGDIRLSSAGLRASVGKYVARVVAANSGPGEVVCPEEKRQDVGGQLYLTGSDLMQRTFQSADSLAAVGGAYMRVAVTTAQMDLLGTTFNMNPGDGDPELPEDARCVVFKLDLPS